MMNWYASMPWSAVVAPTPTRTPAPTLGRATAALSCRETGDPFPGGHEARRSLRIGLSSSLSWGFLRELIRRVRGQPAAPDLAFLEGAPRDCVAAVRRGRIDIAFVHGAPDVSRLKSEALWSEPLMLMANERHLLARSNAVGSAALLKEPFLACGGPDDFAAQLDLIEAAIGGPPISLECLPVSRETLMNLVGLGLGVALTPSSSVGAFYPGLCYRPLADAKGTTDFRAVWKSDCRNPELGPFLASARALSALWAHDPAHVGPARVA
jgi:DNA-binding transcriptional LysR family regulator